MNLYLLNKLVIQYLLIYKYLSSQIILLNNCSKYTYIDLSNIC